MTLYNALKSLTKEQATAFFCSGLLNETHARNVLIYEYYEERLKSVSKMQARTDTADSFCLSEEQVSVIIRKMKN